ncbi:MAG TPA: acyl-CoA dehydrogenase family protein [Acidimicrobiia bacterium]|jgi:alkylation response protein AidB-like acyl-CoA dehydrogenase|nr:acyl-CoA dehydrogenase family protein [Acidimicrobiia bacterium]
MDARLSPEQVALRDAVAQAVAKLAPKTVAQLDDAERASKLDAAIAAAGWRELRADAGGGAPWASAVEAAIVAEELGCGLADASFIGPTLAADLRRLIGAPVAARMETVALDAGVAVDARGCACALQASAGHVVEVALTRERTGTDLTRPSARVQVDGHGTELTETLSEDVLACWNALGLALSCADLVGVMRGAITLAAEYAKSRQQYGQAVGSFQAVQHLLADALVAMEGSRSVALHAAWAVDALSPTDAGTAGAVAKAYCSRAARNVCETAIQVHGGIGNTWDCLAHVYLRRALVSIDMFGGEGANLARVLEHHGVGGPHGLR